MPICPICSKEFSKYGIKNHIATIHEGRPGPTKGKTSWCKGLTSETDPRVKKQTEDHIRRRVEKNTGQKRTEETRRKMSESALRSPHRRVVCRKNKFEKKDGTVVNLDSSYEIKIAQILDDHDIKWTRPKSLPWIDDEGKRHNYFPDFFLDDHGVYIDTKNDFLINRDARKIELVEQHNNLKIHIVRGCELTYEKIQSLMGV